MQKETLQTLLMTARGEALPDTIVTNGRIVNVFTNTIEDGKTIALKNGYITSIEDEQRTSYPAGVPVLDAQGAYLSPGFMDAHTHLDATYPFYELVPYSLKGGTTTVISECGMVGTGSGIEAVYSFIESTKGQPLRCYFLAPPLTPPFPKMEHAKGITFSQFARLLKRDDFVGIGEAYWTGIVDGDERVLKQAALALSLGKTLEGHAAGARGTRLTQYVLTGISSCHESTTLEEAMEKLRYGVYVMIREGFVRKELPELRKLKDTGVDMRRLILVSDFFDGVMLLEEGYLDSIVRKAIGYGFSPMDAIKMATINVADYYGLRHLGAIAPLRHADILFLKDLEKVSIAGVMVNGTMVVEEGRFTGKVNRYEYGAAMEHTIKADFFSGADFRIAVPPRRTRIRVIEVANETITREGIYPVPQRDGMVVPDPGNDMIPITVINRNAGKRFSVGLIKGTGIKSGAFATTLIWDTCNILAMGSSETDIASAVNRLIELQGGIVIASAGKSILEFPMPVYGTVPLLSMHEIAERTKAIDGKIKEIGATLQKPFLTFQTIPFTGLPFLRITDRGLADIRNKKLVPLFLD